MASYELLGVKWGSQPFGYGGVTVYWSFGGTGNGFDRSISEASYGALIRAAFDAWEAVANIDLVEVAQGAQTDISLGWDALDGKNNTVGVANYSYSGTRLTAATVAFDTAENWSDNPGSTGNSSVNFYSVAVHEIGHALGLGHVDDPTQIMNPTTSDAVVLGSGDIAGIRAIYGARDSSVGTGGNDRFASTAGDDSFYGQSGLDTVAFGGARGSFTVTRTGSESFVVTGQGTDQLSSIERMEFYDGTLAFDIAGNAGQVYRLYEAAFNRTPDAQGLSYWTKMLDGGTLLLGAANGFASSAEFLGLYGSDTTAAIQGLYRNVLGREGSASEVSYWQGQAASAGMGQVLIGFSESNENKAAVDPTLSNGIWLVPTVLGTNARDSFAATSGNDSFYGLGGIDTVTMGAPRANFTVAKSGATLTVTGSGTDSFVDVERLYFSDGTLAFDTGANAGQAYRLYAAAFDRTPDAPGLGFQVNRLDAGASLADVAAGFVASAEFAALYGAAPSANQIVSGFYRNVLDRDGDAAGIAYYEQRLAAGDSVANVLVSFSESPENQTATGPAIADGIWFV